MAESKYDIFISYRRTGGAQYARILQLMLIQRGYKVFLDYDELTDGIFSDKIRAAIREAPVFMLVLSGGSMARCANEGDWVREEITLAVKQQKHIIPVNPDNSFDGFPDAMPAELQEAIGSHQHSEISFGQALGATIDLMIKNRLAPTLGERTSSQHKDEDYAIWYSDIMNEAKKYNGKAVKFKAMISSRPELPNNVFAVGRYIMTCCEADMQFCRFVALCNRYYPFQGEK